MSREKGFTLIELLTVVAIIAICVTLGMTSFYSYRGDAAYAVVSRTVEDAATSVEASLSIPDITLPSVSAFTQSSSGPISDLTARQLLPNFRVPRRAKFQFDFDATCTTSACEQSHIQVNHCSGRDYLRWIKFGDGLVVQLQHVAGIGCN